MREKKTRCEGRIKKINRKITIIKDKIVSAFLPSAILVKMGKKKSLLENDIII
jgi:hypothetical protein